MSFSMRVRTLAPDRAARMMLGCCSFQLVQNIRLGKEIATGIDLELVAGKPAGQKTHKLLPKKAQYIKYKQFKQTLPRKAKPQKTGVEL